MVPTLIRLVPLLGKPSLPGAELLGLADTFTERLAAAGKANLRSLVPWATPTARP
jgi:hypothetical protein